ncbi:MAG: hypothetical protein ACR2QC_01445 [Gammaproteobacteria bacterium]
MNETQKVRLPNVTSLEASAFCGRHGAYNYSVTIEEFDEYDNHGPGHFVGVIVTTKQAELYADGLAACKQDNVDPLSLDGLALRLDASRRHHPNAAYRELVQRALARQATIDTKQAQIDAYAAVVAGYTNIGADKYSGQWWTREPDLPSLFAEYVPYSATEREQLGRNHQIYQAPNGDLIEHLGVTWRRWTKDQTIIEDHKCRASIKGHVYQQPLRSSLAAAARSGALSFGCGSYLGGTCGLEDFERTGIRKNYSGGHCQTAAEKIERLREFLREGIQTRREWAARATGAETHSTLADELECIVPLVTNDCIIQWDGTSH